MSVPIVYCKECGKVRNCEQHLHAKFPPDAAKRWLKKYCRKEDKPCILQYRAGVDPYLAAEIRRLKERENV